MTLLKWTPNTSYDIDKMLNTLMYPIWKDPLSARSNWKPEIDIKESRKSFLITADVAGLNKKDVKININGDQLTISGERKEDIDNSDSHYHFRERSIGEFSRSFNLPKSVNKEKINAHFNNGILSIKLEVQYLYAFQV
jgi:HSP20 family protein